MISERGTDLGDHSCHDALALCDEKAFGNYIAIRYIDYERKPAEVDTSM